MDLLGDTLEKIAWEKAGIIKQNVPVVIGETGSETEKVFISRASECRSNILFADRLYSCRFDESVNTDKKRSYTLLNKSTGEETKGYAGLTGDYQEKNISLVVSACDIIEDRLGLSPEYLLSGIENVIMNTGLQGRWQTIGKDPLIICDTGHNRDGLTWVINQLLRIKKGKIHFVIGFVNDKDLSLVLPLFPADADYYFTRAAVPRALDHNILRQKALEYGLKGSSFDRTSDALTEARQKASSDDIIFVGGSTFIVAEVI
jgi:dihydrofolate synthase/folylpolyglutamate synthase